MFHFLLKWFFSSLENNVEVWILLIVFWLRKKMLFSIWSEKKLWLRCPFIMHFKDFTAGFILDWVLSTGSLGSVVLWLTLGLYSYADFTLGFGLKCSMLWWSFLFFFSFRDGMHFGIQVGSPLSRTCISHMLVLFPQVYYVVTLGS